MASQTTPPEAAAGASPSADPKANAELDQQADATAAELIAATPEADDDIDSLAAQLMGSGGSDGDDSVGLDDYKLNVYGFADFMYSYNVKDYNFQNPYSFFAIGRLNLYVGSELGDNWRTLWETRFTYLPHGARRYNFTDTDNPPNNNNVTDYIDLDRPIRWGGIVLERAWLEKTVDTWLNIRVGHWLTPYGIWNVDHGSPVILGVRRPFIVGEAMLPESQSGIQVHGSVPMGATRLGYNLTVSNGRGPADVYRDFDHNKAVGGRLYAANDAKWGQLTLGVSGYRGKYTDRDDEFVFTPAGDIERQFTTNLQYTEMALAADLKYAYQGFLFQAEGIHQQVAYNDKERAYVPPTFGPATFSPDEQNWGVYGLTGYRFEFWGIMPWIGWERYVDSAPGSETAEAFWGGLNIRPTPRVVLKAQYTYSYFPETTDASLFQDLHFNNLDFQAAWSF
jgi:hypothetical protein